MQRLAAISATFLQVQIAAGARAVQLFDSWAGALSPSDYVRYVQPASQKSGLPIAVLSDEQLLIIHDLGELLTREHYIHIDISCQFH